MAYLSSTCPYCENERQITADKTSWLIHLAKHREQIIEHLAETTSYCAFCSYPELAANKKHASSHYRWAHQKNMLLNWALDNLPKQIIV